MNVSFGPPQEVCTNRVVGPMSIDHESADVTGGVGLVGPDDWIRPGNRDGGGQPFLAPNNVDQALARVMCNAVSRKVSGLPLIDARSSSHRARLSRSSTRAPTSPGVAVETFMRPSHKRGPPLVIGSEENPSVVIAGEALFMTVISPHHGISRAI